MTKDYAINGITCNSCVSKIQSALEEMQEITAAIIDPSNKRISITSVHSLKFSEIQKTIQNIDSKYRISTITQEPTQKKHEESKSWLLTYRPILLVFGYIFGITLVIQLSLDEINYMSWMRHFMAGFFLVFSLFKMLDLRGFANSYQMYDIIAKRWPVWGYIYAFIELLLGIAFLIGYNLLYTNVMTLIVMTVSIIGVLQSVAKKRQIQCACLGAIFDLPMSTVTIIEDLLMIAMSLWMIIFYLT